MAQIIDTLREQDSIKTGLKPSAQFDTLCQYRKRYDAVLNNIIHNIVNGPGARINERIMLDLMLSAGLRVSELLQDEGIKVNALGQIFVRGIKGSNNKLVTPIHFNNYWRTRAMTYDRTFMHISRFSFYKYCKSHGIVLTHGEQKNASVTHAMRHVHVYLMELISLDQSVMSELLGHKSLKNIQYYVSGKKAN